MYDLIAEVLAVQVRRNDNIKGLHVPGSATELKLTLYADDNNSFLTTQQSIVNLFQELQRFEEASGCNINTDKTEGMTLGGAAVPNLPFKILWNPPGGLKVLGIRFFKDPVQTANTTWTEITNKIQTRIETLSTRKLSFRGKTIIANSLLLSKAWHAATVIPANMKVVAAIHTAVFKYLFRHRTQKPPQDVCKLLVRDGGMAVKDFNMQQLSLRINRMRHILDPTKNSHWVRLNRLYTAERITLHNTEWPFLAHVPTIHFEHNRHLHARTWHNELTEHLRTSKKKLLRLNPPSTRGIYGYKLLDLWCRTEISGEAYWNRVTNRRLPWKKIWKTTFQSLDPSHHTDTYYRMLHNALATGSNLEQTNDRTNNAPYETRCFYCHRPDSAYHCFAQCTYARTIWNRFFYVYAELGEEVELTYTESLLSTKLPKDRHKRLLQLTLTNLVVHEIWRSRCEHRYDHIAANADVSTRRINSQLKKIHWAYHNAHPDYVHKLCLPSPICQESSGTLVFNLPSCAVPLLFNVDSDYTSAQLDTSDEE